VYPDDADAANGKVSVLSPLGNALLGLRVGQGSLLRLPYGEARRVKVLGILYQPEAAGQPSI
jgi:regulator of nucleoside diphosphate kinase